MEGDMDQHSTEQPKVSDEEIVADLFRLARTERFKHAAPLLREAESMYPHEPQERIRSCLLRLGEILWDTDHGDYATEYKRHRRHQKSSLSISA